MQLGTLATAEGHARAMPKGVEHAKVARHSQSTASQTDRSQCEVPAAG